MVYREPGEVTKVPERDTLYLVVLSYTKENRRFTVQTWRRAKDSFAALKDHMEEIDLNPSDVWAQGVYSADSFREKELEIE